MKFLGVANAASVLPTIRDVQTFVPLAVSSRVAVVVPRPFKVLGPGGNTGSGCRKTQT